MSVQQCHGHGSRCCLPSTHGRVALSAEQSAKETRNRGHCCHGHEARACEFIDPVGMAPRRDRFLLRKRSDHGLHTSGIEFLKLMRELRDMSKSLNAVTGVSQRGFDQPALETADPRRRTKKVGRSSAFRLTMARSGTDTSVVAVVRSQTQDGEETTTRVPLAGSPEHGLLHATFALLTTGSASTTGELGVEHLKTSTAVCGSSGEDTCHVIS